MTEDKVTSPPLLSRRRVWVPLLVLAVVVLLHGVVLETFRVPSASMQPTLRTGDRIAVLKHVAIHRGDVIVFDGDRAFRDRTDHPGALTRVLNTLGYRTGQTDYVKRVIGMPGDRLVVDKQGRLWVNGAVRQEGYLPAGMPASQQPLDLTVPAHCYFVMGDNRPDSDDSRNHLGDPGGGCVPAGDVVGRVVLRLWPIGSWGTLRS